MTFKRGWLVTVCLVASVLGGAFGSAGQEIHRYIPQPEELKYTFSTTRPVLHLKPGDKLETWTESALGPHMRKPGDTLPPDFRPNPNTGPFYIEGAEPGDTLVVKLIQIEPAHDIAVGIAGPGFGALTGRVTHRCSIAQSRVVLGSIGSTRESRTVEFSAIESDFKVSLPLRPFLGCLAVAPASDEAHSTIVPGFFGGNMDTPEVRVGTTAYLPVSVPGALLFLGDGHAVQGEGEIAGTAAEVPMNVVLSVDVIKGQQIRTPRLEDSQYIMAVGSVRPLEDAMRIASHELIQWLVKDYGLSPMDAYELLSVAMESNVSQIVDPNYTAIVKIRKEYLPHQGE